MKQNKHNLSHIQHYSIEVEQAVLGSLIAFPEQIKNYEKGLSDDLFYDKQNRAIAKIIINLNKQGKSVDLPELYEASKKEKEVIINPVVFTDLMSARVTLPALQDRIFYLKDLLVKRRTIELCQKAMQSIFEGEDIADVQDSLTKGLEKSQELLYSSSGLVHISEYYKQSAENSHLKVERKRKGETIGVPTGLKDLDKVLNGWQNSKVYVLAARPAMGKTAIALKFAKTAVMQGYSTAIFSLEMSGESLSDRLILSESDIEPWRYESGAMSDEDLKQVDKAIGRLYDLPLFVDDNAMNTIDSIKSKARSLQRREKLGRKGLDFIIIDYLQLADVQDRTGQREQTVAQISRETKILSKYLDVPILMLSQLSREVERRIDKKPQLSDLRESGAIEQDADCVMFIYRPEYYGVECKDNKNNVVENGIVISTAKNRAGATGDIICQHNGTLHKIFDYNSNPF